MSVSETDKPVTSAAVIDAEVGQRIAWYWRRKHPRHTEKLTARDCKVCEVTARKWLAGVPPSRSHLFHMLANEPPDFAALVLEMFPWARVLRLDAQIDRLGEHLDRIAAEYQRLRSETGGSGQK